MPPKPCILASSKSWHDGMAERLAAATGHDFVRVSNPDELSDTLSDKSGEHYIFFPHWSWIIPKAVWQNHECVIFHMTDLPFGRGGSPLQNLIVRGVKQTKMSALRCGAGLDTGDIYCKASLSLEGTAQEIFLRSVPIVEQMILTILRDKPTPEPQTGDPVVFTRRKPEDGTIQHLKDLSEVYDYIRMLDAETYPPAFLETDNLRLEFKGASLGEDAVTATVTISKKASR